MIRRHLNSVQVLRVGGLGLAIVLLLGLVAMPATGRQGPSSRPSSGWSFQGETNEHADIDARKGVREPSIEQRSLAADLGAEVSWNDFGTPRSLINHGSWLGTGLGSDPVDAARTWIGEHRALFRLSAEGVAALELVRRSPIGDGAAVTFRQTFDGVPASPDGQISLGTIEGKIAYVSSSLSGAGGTLPSATMTPKEAVTIAAGDAGFTVDGDDISSRGTGRGWARFQAEKLSHTQLARLVAVPTPLHGVRLAYETFVFDNSPEPVAFTHFVDAQTGEIIIRTDAVDQLQEEEEADPSWRVFPNTPPMDYSSTDTRVVWCWASTSPDCERTLINDASPFAWDVDARTGEPTFTTRGNNARGTEKWLTNNSGQAGSNFATPRPERDYDYAWTNQWNEQRCNPDVFTSPERNDIDAATANLFAMHNRMHDWSYFLGFNETNSNLQDFNFGKGGLENDPEHGNSQAGGIVGGPPGYESRDNANQVTPPDGSLPVTNMFLWQPIPAGFYSPCVDGDYDMSVIGHEYTHAISNRMVAGPDGRLRGPQAGAMGESWSDLSAIEYLQEFDFAPVGNENPFAVGPYVTGDPSAGIRNYGMNASPLNYSNVAYDFVGAQVHADGEIWSATNYDIRVAMNRRYDRAFPSKDTSLQRQCADGELEPDQCPGNRRWIQLVFDAWPMMSEEVSMVDARDALLAADMLRFGGANQALLWNVFASRGLGENASSNTNADADPTPSFESPFSNEATVRFRVEGKQKDDPSNAQIFVGDYEARTVPIADTDPATPRGETARLVPGRYEFIARADGFGMSRFTATVKAGESRRIDVKMETNLASASNGATATGDGVNLDKLIDDTEVTNWASLSGEAQGKKVTVQLAPSEKGHKIGRVQVSAMLRPTEPADPGGDTGGQSRFSALRQFEILTCSAREEGDCTEDSDFRRVLTSPEDAFPSVAPRPRAPDLIMRSFKFKSTDATHVQLRVLDNQCTGAPDYRGDQDDDPRHNTDCVQGSVQGTIVRAAELQVFDK